MTALHVHAWGDPDAPPVVCLHGITGWGGHFEQLATRFLDGYRVLAPDLIGHGASSWEPPWTIAAQLDALEETLGEKPQVWLGHSYGARLAYEHAARRADSVSRLVLLDPALYVPPHVALQAAESSLGDRSYASPDEALEQRFAESQLRRAPRELVAAELERHLRLDPDGRWRYRYSQASVVAAYGEMASTPASFDRVAVRTLLLLGRESYLPYDLLVDAHRSALGDLLEETSVAGGHTVLWDALDETGAAIRAFLDA